MLAIFFHRCWPFRLVLCYPSRTTLAHERLADDKLHLRLKINAKSHYVRLCNSWCPEVTQQKNFGCAR